MVKKEPKPQMRHHLSSEAPVRTKSVLAYEKALKHGKLDQYLGRYVIFVNGKFIGSADSPAAARQEAQYADERGDIVVRLITQAVLQPTRRTR